MTHGPETYFFELFQTLQKAIGTEQTLLASIHGEVSNFVRFNHGKERQSGTVEQFEISLKLISGQKIAEATITLCGNPNLDLQRLSKLLQALTTRLSFLPDDPFLNYNTQAKSTYYEKKSALPPIHEAIGRITCLNEEYDLVGILAHGEIFTGFANSLGQKNWFSQPSFNFDWSIFSHSDKAAKGGYAGFEWNEEILESKLRKTQERLSLLKAPQKTIRPGTYRVFLTPKAVSEICGLLKWGSFSKKSIETKTSSLLKMVNGEKNLDSRINIREESESGVSPRFNSFGFLKQNKIDLIHAGQFGTALTSPRSAQEYGVDTNGAENHEHPDSLRIDGGTLEESEILSELDTGLYISNLWYLNFSDRNNCRMTGMTRFATFWVEGGRIRAPLNVMRFDDSLFRMLGENLVNLTKSTERLFDSSTYHRRSTSSMELPGMLLSGLTLTL